MILKLSQENRVTGAPRRAFPQKFGLSGKKALSLEFSLYLLWFIRIIKYIRIIGHLDTWNQKLTSV